MKEGIWYRNGRMTRTGKEWRSKGRLEGFKGTGGGGSWVWLGHVRRQPCVRIGRRTAGIPKAWHVEANLKAYDSGQATRRSLPREKEKKKEEKKKLVCCAALCVCVWDSFPFFLLFFFLSSCLLICLPVVFQSSCFCLVLNKCVFFLFQ